jgi:hypothetical protein
MNEDTHATEPRQEVPSEPASTAGPVASRELILARGLLALMRRHGEHGGAKDESAACDATIDGGTRAAWAVVFENLDALAVPPAPRDGEPRATAKQLAMMRHATGGAVQGHRNYYCVPAGPSDTRDAWLDLVASGLAGAGEPPDASDPGGNQETVFHVTPSGFRMTYGSERRPGRMGDVGLRDPAAPCTEFEPGEPDGRCETDGHYMCRECIHGKFCETCDQIEAQCECPVDDEPVAYADDLVVIRLPGWRVP